MLFSKCKNIKSLHSDGYKPYIKYMKQFISGVRHTTDKCFTTHIESLNSLLRHYIAGFNRRSRNILKTSQYLSNILNLFLLLLY